MNILGIDTSTAASAACVVRGDGRAFEVEPPVAALEQRPAHSTQLLPGVARCLEEAGLGYSDLDVVAVGAGPGAFTGLRIGVATARALAGAHGAELRTVSSLAALALCIEEPVALPLIDARRGELFAALYEDGRQTMEALAAAPEDVAARVVTTGKNPLAAGDGSVRFREVLEAAGIRVAPPGSRTHVVRGLSICRLACTAPPQDRDAVLPDYLRLPDAKPL
ncbi:MAG: tRNA (adenosine(37)-N6)-threonylcarbamoyltransferase complex dimerization subunit type 1 TsaB [Actinomycetota bacterium]|nr:tRNA (adenosine(37)-N6)-threonylcarbamoyltransferase complex dimerization subunit type 1 TsaB [Actinomycetota bacterium]